MMTDGSDGAVRLVTRGDDAALAESANDAILECFEEGVLRNVSVMAPCPALEHAAETLAGVDDLCVGVHVTLTAEWDDPGWGPVLPADEVPSLVNEEDEFYQLPEDLLDQSPDRDEIVAEMEAQLRRLEDVGFDVAYADTHMAFEQHRDWFAELFADFCERKGLVNGPETPLPPDADGPGTGPEWLLDQLDGIEPGTYLVVGHPAYDDEEMAGVVGLGNERGEVAADRVGQRRMFTNERIQEYILENGVEVVRYDDLET